MNFSKLEQELNGMMKADELYWTRNDAKFRAAKQNVPYEEFEQIVKASHLKPLDKKDKLEDAASVVTICNPYAKPKTSIIPASSDSTIPQPTIDKVSREEDRTLDLEWVQITLFDRKAPLDIDTILKIISVLDGHWDTSRENDKTEIKNLIKQLRAVPRFDLELAFACKKDRDRVEAIISRISS